MVEATEWDGAEDLALPNLTGRLRWRNPVLSLVRSGKEVKLGTIEPEKNFVESQVTISRAGFVDLAQGVVVRFARQDVARDANGPLFYESMRDAFFRVP